MNPLPEDNWSPWSPSELQVRLEGMGEDWYIVGGWALDLWHGRQTREHEDLEFSVLSIRSQHYRRALSGLEFFSVADGKLSHLPSAAVVPSNVWQQWGADVAAGCWRVDMMVDRGTHDHWVYKRDPALRMPRTTAIRTTEYGIPYLAPSIVLLFKAKHAREKDHHDFHIALPRLKRQERADLRRWLEMLHPGHAWIELLGSE
ncbi:amino acid transporter [Rhizobiaceae bacterium BDR2-2]|uniref:Amino acid transporter n=1 Tax=Ectorhizobium quercum TaxID=2965071 RepID=A0AAE3SUU5_9HYPH|nr:amino acid transporter [Ectorhizobium quercum]MCX8995665.1 amino acid transporter [Ectorhizobium quercum]